MALTHGPSGIGPKRLVVGAHYGIGGFLGQRLTAIVLTLYVVILALRIVFGGRGGYDNWAALFAPTWFKILTLVAWTAVAYHAWIGVRDIWMDYIKPASVRLALQTLTVLWLVACTLWAVQILWSV